MSGNKRDMVIHLTEVTTLAARGTSVFLSQLMISGILRILNITILTRLLFQDQMGQIAFLGIIFGLMQILGSLGLNHASPLVIPEEEKLGSSNRLKSYLIRSLIIIVFASSSMTVLLLFLSPILFSSINISQSLIQLVILIGPFSALEVFLDSFLLGRYSIKKLAVGRLLFDIIRISLTILLVISGFGVEGVMIGWLVSEIFAVFAFGAASIQGLKSSPQVVKMAPVLAFALPSFLFQLIDVTIQNTDRIILLQLSDLATLGVFDVFLRVLFMLSLVSLTIATSIYPLVTRLRVKLDEEEQGTNQMRIVTATLLRYIFLIIGPVAIITSLNSHTIIEVLFGSAYADFPDASLSFSILVLSYALWAMVYGIHTILRSMGEARFFVVMGLGIIAFEIVACWYFTSLFGLLGTSVVRSLYIVLLLVSALGRLRQKGVGGFTVVTKSILRIGVISVICGLLVVFAVPYDFITLLIWVLLSGVLYLVLIFLTREVIDLDFTLAKAILPSKIHSVIDRIRRGYMKQ